MHRKSFKVIKVSTMISQSFTIMPRVLQQFSTEHYRLLCIV